MAKSVKLEAVTTCCENADAGGRGSAPSGILCAVLALSAPSSTDWSTLGVYTPQQVAALLGVEANKAKRWVYGSGKGDPAILPRYPAHAGRFFTFTDVIQAMTVRDVRNRSDDRISLSQIRQAVDSARKLGVDFPFARPHRVLEAGNGEIVLEVEGRIITLTGKQRLSYLIEPIVRPHLRDINYGNDHLASEWIPRRQDGFQVVLDPRISYGAPVVQPGNHRVRTLVDAVGAEGSLAAAAAACEVDEEAVRLAVDYELSLENAA